MGPLSLAALGTPEVRYGGRALSFPTRKTLALLLYLATEGGLHSREHLVALLWPDSDEERGRGALRSTLSFLRGVLREATGRADPQYLVAERDRLGFAASADVDFDLQALEAAFALARGPARAPTEQLVARLQAAANRYRGDFLAGFSLGDAPAFDDWASVQREAWHRRMDLVFERLAQELSDGGELVGAIETTARWAAFDPLNEAAHRQLMRLHFAAADRAAALRAYEACRAVLAAELNAEPAPDTAALAARIRAEVPPPSERLPDEPAIPLVTVEAPLVGRSGEHAHLVAAYRAARRGRPRVVVVEGESGIGKTRLATEFLRWAAAQGAAVLQGRALETGGRLPYHPLIEALRGPLAGMAGRDPGLREVLGDVWLAELGRLLPEVRDRYPGLPAPPGLGDAEARGRLFEAVARLGRALAAGAPLVVLIDDAQWADAASLDALRYACRRWAAMAAPILFVIAVRAEDLGATPALAEWLGGLERELPLTRLALGPLTVEDTRRLLHRASAGHREPAAREAPGIGPPAANRGLDDPGRPLFEAPDAGPPVANRGLDDLSRWLFAETGGHPFFITETVKALFERGALRLDPAGDWSAAPDTPAGDELRPDGLPLPHGFVAPGVREVILARLARLGAPARAALAAGAVLGDGFAFEPLCRVAGVGEDDALPALDELLSRRLLRESAGRYRFGHDKVREVAYAEAGEARRRVYHRRALDALEPLHVAPAELARHALAAGLAERAFGYSVAAGDGAMRLFAVRDALVHYEQAERLAPALPTALAAEVYRLYARLGRAYELTDQYAPARAAYEAMLALARERAEPGHECAALNGLATVAAHELDWGAQAAYLRRALAVAEASGDTAGLLDTEWNLGRLTWFRSDFAAARAHNERALALARDLGSPEPLARSLNWLALTEVVQGRWPDTLRHAEEARALYAALGNRALEADCLAAMAAAHIRLGQARAGVAAARAALTIGREIDNRWSQADAAKELALGLVECGEYAEALTVARAGLEVARAAEYPPLLTLNLTILGTIQRHLGMPATARDLHREALAVDEGGRVPAFTELVLAELCADAARLGDWDEAHARARQALAVRHDAILYAGFTRWHEIEALLHAGDRDAAESDARRFGERIGDNRRYRIPYLRALAALAEGRADTGRAIGHLREAATLAEQLELPGERWAIVAALGELYEAYGHPEQTRQAFACAAAIVQALASELADEEMRATFLAAEPVRRVLARQR